MWLRWLALFLAIALTVAAPKAWAAWFEAGPIWNNQDAQGKCPNVCGAQGWDGNWMTTKPGRMSVCSCGGTMPPAQTLPVGPLTSCSTEPTIACRGCSITCPSTNAAYCSGGQDTSGDNPMCWTQPTCECR